MSVVDVLFGLLGLATVIGYGYLVWLGMSPERALGFVIGGGLMIGLLARVAIGVLTPGGTSPDPIHPSEGRGDEAGLPGPPHIPGETRAGGART